MGFGGPSAPRTPPLSERTVLATTVEGQDIFREVNTNQAFIQQDGAFVRAEDFDTLVDPFVIQRAQAEEQNQRLLEQQEAIRAETITAEQVEEQARADQALVAQAQSVAARQEATQARRSGSAALINPGLSIPDEEI